MVPNLPAGDHQAWMTESCGCIHRFNPDGGLRTWKKLCELHDNEVEAWRSMASAALNRDLEAKMDLERFKQAIDQRVAELIRSFKVMVANSDRDQLSVKVDAADLNVLRVAIEEISDLTKFRREANRV